VFLTCVDHLLDSSRTWPARYELLYELRDLETREQIRVRAFVDGDPPHIDSVHDLFPPANWDERETYDLFGVVFENHPDLTRILMPDDWVGHPLRRDYQSAARWSSSPKNTRCGRPRRRKRDDRDRPGHHGRSDGSDRRP